MNLRQLRKLAGERAEKVLLPVVKFTIQAKQQGRTWAIPKGWLGLARGAQGNL
ncbi:MAG: hypothetical protein L0170_18385 [Acidobacteria bacterium]|nr:hypothetical protein [Acidobacteriota bacterium]